MSRFAHYDCTIPGVASGAGGTQAPCPPTFTYPENEQRRDTMNERLLLPESYRRSEVFRLNKLILPEAYRRSDLATITLTGAPIWQNTTSNTHAGGGSGVPITANKPAGTVEGNLLVALWGGLNGLGAADVTPPAGWTPIASAGVGATPISKSYWLKAGASEPASYTFTCIGGINSMTLEIHRIVGQHATTPIDTSTTGVVLAAGLDPDPSAPAITTGFANCMVFAWLLHDHLALTQTHTEPASHLERTDIEANDLTLKLSSTSATRTFATAGLQAAVEFDCTETVATNGSMQRISIRGGGTATFIV